MHSTVNHEVFVGKIFVLKNFRRVDVLRKYFNAKILQHRSGVERTERVTAMESFWKEIAFAATTYICKKKYGRRRLERRCVRKRAQKLFRSIRCGCEKRRNYHRTFTSKAVAGVFAVFATGKYTVASMSVEGEHVEWRGV